MALAAVHILTDATLTENRSACNQSVAALHYSLKPNSIYSTCRRLIAESCTTDLRQTADKSTTFQKVGDNSATNVEDKSATVKYVYGTSPTSLRQSGSKEFVFLNITNIKLCIGHHAYLIMLSTSSSSESSPNGNL